jgi:hypothetical protein
MKWLKGFFTAPERDRPLLDLIDENAAQNALHGHRSGSVSSSPQYPPVTYIDGSRDELCEALDVLADAAAAPGAPTPEAA